MPGRLLGGFSPLLKGKNRLLGGERVHHWRFGVALGRRLRG